jgi:Short-chain dehydrogenases of various substrate specificities
MAHRPETLADVSDVDCSGTHALVTGSTSGIGRETALALGRLGANVMVHGRDEAAGQAVVDELTEIGREATFTKADFASVDEIKQLAAAVRGMDQRTGFPPQQRRWPLSRRPTH